MTEQPGPQGILEESRGPAARVSSDKSDGCVKEQPGQVWRGPME